MKISWSVFLIGIVVGFLLCKATIPIPGPVPEPKPDPVRAGRPRIVHRMVVTNVPTRRIDDYKNIGHLNSEHRILPLYGRQVHRGSQLWQYYTISDGNIPVHLTFEHQGRDCGSEYGCKELYDGDSVIVDEYGTTFNVNINKEYLRYVMYA